MSNWYRGVYVQRLNNGQIYSVQVVAPGLILMTLPPREYAARGIQPPMDKLPDAEEYFAKLSNP